MANNKRVVPMWFVTNQPIYEDALFHYHDKERAERQAKYQSGDKEIKLVWVVVPSDYFVGTWQFANLFEGYIFDTKEEAMEEGGWIAKNVRAT